MTITYRTDTEFAGHPGKHVCAVASHLCGDDCKLLGKRGCLEECTKVINHEGDEHMCSALVHMCGEPCALKDIVLPGGNAFSCQESCSIPSDQEHESHLCDVRLCPATCELCKRLCAQPHLHGLMPGTHHLCGEAHSCSESCAAPGICTIELSPQAIEATFNGKHETFQYTRYSQVAKRAQCVQTIPSGLMTHEGEHIHSREAQPFHHCETRCGNCGYFCTLPLGHSQQEHETSHGSMTHTRWAVDGPDDVGLELGGRKFSSNDEGAPMMCNLVCSSMGRHVHIDYCRAEANGPCEGDEVQHINEMMVPDPDRPKDAVTHSLYWRRMGFKDPYTRDDQAIFSKCDAMCPGSEHSGADAQPSYCTLTMFHPDKSPNDLVDGLGYVSNDGHMFSCRNPAVLQQAFHVIFVIDRSSSMSSSDRQPLPDAPASKRIRENANNRLGAVYSALYSFWSARHAVVTSGLGARRDAYSIILFENTTLNAVVNDFTSTPDQLLDIVLKEKARGGTDFTTALKAGKTVMINNWSTERTPVMVFLSDGQCSVRDEVVMSLCRSAIELGKPLSFHSVFFGPDGNSSSSSFKRPFSFTTSFFRRNYPTSTLRTMAEVAFKIQQEAPPDPLSPTETSIPSSFHTAIDTVHLAETFLGIAEALRKPRGALMR